MSIPFLFFSTATVESAPIGGGLGAGGSGCGPLGLALGRLSDRRSAQQNLLGQVPCSAQTLNSPRAKKRAWPRAIKTVLGMAPSSGALIWKA